MSDINQVNNMLDNTDLESMIKKEFASEQREFQSDNNNGDYSTGFVNFNMPNLREEFINYADSEIFVPLSISNPNFTGPLEGSKYGIVGGKDIIRWKGTCASLFGDINIKNNQDTVIKESLTYFANTVKIPLEHAHQWYHSGDSQMLGYSYDDASNLVLNTSTDPGVLTLIGNAPLTQTIATDVMTTANDWLPTGSITSSATFSAGNSGLLKGMNDFFANFTYNAGSHTYTGDVVIKLRELSNFFKEIDFPISASFDLYFTMNFYNGNTTGAIKNMPPLQVLTSSTLLANYVNVPTASTGNTTITIGNGNGVNGATACRFYYKSIKFSSSVGKIFAEQYARDTVKPISFVTTNVFSPATLQGNNLTTNVDFQITPGIKNVMRLWMLGYNHAYPLNSYGTNGCGFIDPNVLKLTNFNVRLNNKNYYNQNLTRASEFYDEAVQTTATYGVSDETHSLLGIDNWRNANSVYVFDLTRVGNRMTRNSTVSIDAEFTNSTGVSCDYVFLVDRLQHMKLKFSDRGCVFEVED